METILSYLENMFINLPDTPEIARAKKRTCCYDGGQI